MSIISTIAKQEIFKVFKNKKMLTSIFFMPVVILIAMFAMTSIGMEESEESQTYQIYFPNMQVAEQEVETEDIHCSSYQIQQHPMKSFGKDIRFLKMIW